ncbi:hypothetical protein WA026_008517 [Henosepilachna vigintioctopunctata]
MLQITILEAAVTICVMIVAAFFIFMGRNFNRWKKDNVPFLKPKPIFGNILDVCRMKITFGELCKNIYDGISTPFIGIFILDKPGIIIKDLDLVRDVLIKDFEYFMDRSLANNEKNDIMGSNMLFLMKSPKWNIVRKKMTPIFTTSKIKMMSALMQRCSEQMMDYISKKTIENTVLDVRDISVKYAVNSITSASFGLEAGCFEESGSLFRVVSERIYNWKRFSAAIQTICFFFAPFLVKLFSMKFIDTMSSNCLKEYFWKTMNERETKNVSRGDLLDILREMKKQEETEKLESLDENVIVAQAVQFFAAGFETTSASLAFALLELARNSEIQQKLRNEIVRINEEYGSISYNGLRDMEYLDKVVHETLRKYPILPFLDRRCNKSYNNVEHGLKLQRDDLVYIPVLAIHYDEKYYPNPETFDPERFSRENAEKRHNMSYLPFGEGPRVCIGKRFALLNLKSGLAHILLDYEVKICRKTVSVHCINPRGITLQPKSEVYLEFVKVR